jgi:hypothetical protein
MASPATPGHEKGFNLAAILLLGRDEVIRSCVPGYITDAILRRKNLDPYDDRLMVEINRIDNYDLLMEFVAKHTLDRFFLVDILCFYICNKRFFRTAIKYNPTAARGKSAKVLYSAW